MVDNELVKWFEETNVEFQRMTGMKIQDTNITPSDILLLDTVFDQIKLTPTTRESVIAVLVAASMKIVGMKAMEQMYISMTDTIQCKN